jgi:methyl-accepting chemotaxis protein
MFANMTFTQRLAVPFGIAVIILMVIAGLAYWAIDNLVGNDGWVEHTTSVRTVLATLRLDLADAESDQRGYLLTGQESYVAPYDAAATAAGAQLAQFRRLTADNGDEQRRADAMQPLLEKRLSLLKAHLDIRRAQGIDAAIQAVAADGGQEVMNSLASLIDEADASELALLATRTAAAEASAYWAKAITLGGGILGVLAVALFGWLIARALTLQIGSAVTHVQSSSAELQSAASQQASGVREQLTSVSEINTTISELMATSRQIADSARRVSQIAEQTTSAARSGDGIVDRANNSIVGIRRQVDLVVGHMLELGKKSQQIGSVLDIVTELAEQTNILSINATIEAAGAGESGKRFSVVADEIRKLADRVAGAAKEIRSLIDDVRSSVNTTVMATETGSKAVDTGTSQFDDVATQFKEIARLVATTTEAAREIELSTQQQATAVEQVNLAMATVTQATRETEASAGQTIQTANELVATSRNLLKLVQTGSAA